VKSGTVAATVPFDHQLVEAKLALNRIDPGEMPSLAWDALEAGLDGPSIRRLAALNRPSGWEADQVLPGFMAESGLKRISQEEASVTLACQLASRIISEGLDPLAYSRDFELLWINAGHPRAIQDPVCSTTKSTLLKLMRRQWPSCESTLAVSWLRWQAKANRGLTAEGSHRKPILHPISNRRSFGSSLRAGTHSG